MGLAAAAVLAVWAGRLLFGSLSMTGAVAPQEESRSQGKPSAPFWIVEYVDYQCTACAEAQKILTAEIAKQPAGSVFFQVRFFPIKNHPHGFLSAQYADCAARQGNFWRFHEKLYETQFLWSPAADPRPFFEQTAGELGIEAAALRACAESPETEDRIWQEKKAAIGIGVNSTPTVFLNGNRVTGLAGLRERIGAFFASGGAAAPKEEGR